MKNKWFVFVLIGWLGMGSLSAQNDAISKYFNKYLENDQFFSMHISPRMFGLFSKRKQNGEMKETIRKLTSLRILSADSAYASNGTGIQLYKEAMKTIQPQNYEELMGIRDGDENVRFYALSKDDPDLIHELVMLVGGDHSFFLMSITGSFTIQEISDITEGMEIDGMDKLEHLEKEEQEEEE